MISVYGLKQTLADRRALIADVIFDCMQMSLGVPKQRHALRFDLLMRKISIPQLTVAKILL